MLTYLIATLTSHVAWARLRNALTNVCGQKTNGRKTVPFTQPSLAKPYATFDRIHQHLVGGLAGSNFCPKCNVPG